MEIVKDKAIKPKRKTWHKLTEDFTKVFFTPMHRISITPKAFAEYVYNDIVLAREGSIKQGIAYEIGRLEQAQYEVKKMLTEYRAKWLGPVRFIKKIKECAKAIYTYDQMIATYKQALVIIDRTDPETND
jgi:hypothetical protein